jgi:hypothetical protein
VTALLSLFACLAIARADVPPSTCIPGPRVRAVAGMPAFSVFADCRSKDGKSLGVAMALADGKLPMRTQLDTLLRALYAQVRSAMGRKLPPRVEVCVYPHGTAAWSAEFLACIRLGFENEEAEGNAPSDDDDEPQIENHAPFTPAEEVRRMQSLFPRGRVQVSGDEQRHTLKVVYDFDAPPAFVDAALAFFAVATRVYPATTSLVTLDFVGMRQGKVVLRVRVADERTFLAMGPWPMRERLSQAGIALDPKRARTPAQTKVLEAELRAAIEKLPKADVQLTP